jgi:pimeloyl-ACP methyl ester carboxylesterase
MHWTSFIHSVVAKTIPQLFLFVGLLVCPFSSAEALDCDFEIGREGPQSVQVDVEGIHYAVAISADCWRGGCPVLVDLHGAMMRATGEELESHLRSLGANAVARGAPKPFIVIQPTASGHPSLWKTGDPERIYEFSICAARRLQSPVHELYIGGFSQGARTAAEALCSHPSAFAAAAFVAGGGDILAECITSLTSADLSILYVHGLRDLMLSPLVADDLTTALRQSSPGEHLTVLKVSAEETQYQGSKLFLDVILHNYSGGFAGGHCVPGGSGPVGCAGTFIFGERAIDFYIAHRIHGLSHPLAP